MKVEQRTIDSLIDELKITRLATKALFESFDDQTMDNTGTNWKYEISVLALRYTIIGHEIHHLKMIEEEYYPLLDELGWVFHPVEAVFSRNWPSRTLFLHLRTER